MVRAISMLASAALLLGAAAAAAQERDEELPGVGADAPSFALPVYNSEAAKASRAGTMLLVGEDSDDQATKVIVVSFMASHCKPCLEELPFLQKLHEKNHAKGLRIVGVSIDSEPEGQKLMGELLAEHKVTFPVARDQYNFTARRFLGTKVPLPSVFVLERSGLITFVSRGYNEEISRNLVSAIEAKLGVKPVGAEVEK
jgi:thiol-disulfide isomerase/thioredoxin